MGRAMSSPSIPTPSPTHLPSPTLKGVGLGGTLRESLGVPGKMITPPGHDDWLKRQEQRRVLRAELAACRLASKQKRHERRMAQIEKARTS